MLQSYFLDVLLRHSDRQRFKSFFMKLMPSVPSQGRVHLFFLGTVKCTYLALEQIRRGCQLKETKTVLLPKQEFYWKKWYCKTFKMQFYFLSYVHDILVFCKCIQRGFFNPLSANSTKWWNTLKQFVGNFPTNCWSVFDHFVKLTQKGLIFTL